VRFITKGEADDYLSKRNEKPPSTPHKAKLAWKGFKSRRKLTLIKCLDEQLGLCGYSEVELSNETPIIDPVSFEEVNTYLGTHLEHIEPKSFNPSRTFDHNNLIACTIDDVKVRKLEKSDVFGGHSKLGWYNEDALVHPLLPNCQNYFHYEITGLIVPKLELIRRERAKARLTIYKLNLNAPALVIWRRNWLSQINLQINEVLDDPISLKKLAQSTLLPSNKKLTPFHSAQRQSFGSVGNQVIQESAEVI
jgi:uncharacterized protein (TIGR02646 family)